MVVDESGTVGTGHLHRLIVATTTAGAKLVLVGDPKQLAEIEAGAASGPWPAGSATTSSPRTAAQQQTARALRDAKTDQALLRLHRTGSLTLDANAERLRDRVAEDWYLEHADGKHAVMLALHRSDVTDINRRPATTLPALAGSVPSRSTPSTSTCASGTPCSHSVTTTASGWPTAPRAP